MIIRGEDLEFALRLRKYVVDGIADSGFVMARRYPADADGVYLFQAPRAVKIGTFSYQLRDGYVVHIVDGVPVFFSHAKKYRRRHEMSYEELLTHLVDNVRISFDLQSGQA